MKYHYFHGRFTYSVKRNGRSSAGRELPFIGGSVGLAALPASILVLKREPSRGVGASLPGGVDRISRRLRSTRACCRTVR